MDKEPQGSQGQIKKVPQGGAQSWQSKVHLGAIPALVRGWVLLISAQAGSAREDNRVDGDCLAELTLLTVGVLLGEEVLPEPEVQLWGWGETSVPSSPPDLGNILGGQTARKSHSGPVGSAGQSHLHVPVPQGDNVGSFCL